MREDDQPSDDEEPTESLEPTDAREAARVRRRNHDLDAAGRDLMRPGMGKVFKQILDRQARDADHAGEPRQRRRRHRS
jgi:hypothetical protein